MKVIVVGGMGTVGQAVVKELANHHEVIIVGQYRGEVQVDIKEVSSIRKMYEKIGPIDAVVSAAGKVYWGNLTEMTPENYGVGLADKLMGQINLVSIGLPYLNEKGSFTLISGILSEDPIRFGTSASMVNGAINSFVRASAIEMPKGIRINAISPTVLTESMEAYADYFPGFEPVPAARVALAYRKSVEGAQTGQIYKVGY